jgi:hypothetical protein
LLYINRRRTAETVDVQVPFAVVQNVKKKLIISIIIIIN